MYMDTQVKIPMKMCEDSWGVTGLWVASVPIAIYANETFDAQRYTLYRWQDER